MKTKLIDLITRGQKTLEGLIRINALPEAQLMEFSSAEFSTGLIQIFVGPHSAEGNRDNARMVARVFGGVWTVEPDGTWQTRSAECAGFEGVTVVIHYVEPKQNKEFANIVDLSE